MRSLADPRRGLTAWRRHLWFVLIVVAVAFASAVASLFLLSPSKDAAFRTTVKMSNLPPLYGGETLPTLDDLATLATSPEVIQQTSQTLEEQSIQMTSDQLSPMLSVSPDANKEALDFTVKGDDADLNLAVAGAWSDAFAGRASTAAAELERQASLPYQTQLAQAAASLATKRQAVADLGGSAIPAEEASTPTSQWGALGTSYQAKAAALASLEVERTGLQNTINTLRSQGGTLLSADQLRLLLGGVLPAEAVPSRSLAASDAADALQLRLTAVDGSIASLGQEVQGLEATINQGSGDLQRAITEMQAAEENYQAASRLTQSYDLVGQSLQIGVSVVQAPHVRRIGPLDWLARLGGAAAFALIIGLVGSAVLDRVPRRRVRARESEARPSGSQAAGQAPPRPQPPAPAERQVLSATLNPPLPPEPKQAPSPRGPTRYRYPTGFLLGSLAVMMLAGLLGTFGRRQYSSRRARRPSRR